MDFTECQSVRPAGPGLMGTLMWPEHHLPHQTGKECTSSKRTKPARGKILVDADSESDRVTGAQTSRGHCRPRRRLARC